MARPNLTAMRTAASFSTGNTPGSPKSTGQAKLFGGAPNWLAAAEKILLCVASWTWTSKPMTASHPAFKMPPRGLAAPHANWWLAERRRPLA